MKMERMQFLSPCRSWSRFFLVNALAVAVYAVLQAMGSGRKLEGLIATNKEFVHNMIWPTVGYVVENRNMEPFLYNLYQDGNFSYVKTAKYVHTFPANASVRVTPNPPMLKTVGLLSQDFKQSAYDYPAGNSFLVRAVYYINLKVNRNYGTWILNQLLILAPVDELYVVADAYDCAEEPVLHQAYKWLKASRKERVIELECHNTNNTELFEYHGIHKIWELGQKYPGRNDIGIYFHSKGLTHASSWEDYDNSGRRFIKMEKVLGVAQMEQVQEAFQLFPDVDIAGEECGFKGHFVWYNFWYARGSYLNTVEQPIVTTRRHYYEDWLARSGLPPQEGAPYAPERNLVLYPHIQSPDAYCCYALMGGRSQKKTHVPNIGFYFDVEVGKRVQIGDNQY